MDEQLVQLKSAIAEQEIKLWELMDVENRLREQIEQIERCIETTDPIEDKQNVALNSIGDIMDEYDTQLWQILESKLALNEMLKLLQTNSKTRDDPDALALPQSNLIAGIEELTGSRDDLEPETSSGEGSHNNVAEIEPDPGANTPNSERSLRRRPCPSQTTLSASTIREHAAEAPAEPSCRLPKCRTKYKGPGYLCNECGKTFHGASGLKAHSAVHAGVKNHVCPKCGKQFTHSSVLCKHMRTHDNERAKFKCDICGRAYITKSFMETHRTEKHAEELPHACTECGRKFAAVESLNAHLKGHQRTRIQCTHCLKYFLTKHYLSTHIERVHRGERKFECPDCSERFFDKQVLIAHQATHNGTRQFACTKCDGRYFTARALNTHQKVHANVRPFKCEQCDSSFRVAGSLKRHMNSHTNARPYRCDLCGAQFADFGYIKVHMRIHTGEKPFPCSVCNKRFLDRRNMKKHMKTHSK